MGKWLCQGCDAELVLRPIDKWRTLEVSIKHADAPPIISEQFELCPTCQIKLMSLADPRKWPRERSQEECGLPPEKWSSLK